MIYELEHIEAEVGSYPATEGFLYLLTTLIKAAGCPSDLGSHWRLRPGCSPYIEYVTDFVLPRASGIAKNVKPLPFATAADECRLISRSLEVIEAILVRYVVPPVTQNSTLNEVRSWNFENIKKASEELGLSSIISTIFCDSNNLDQEDINDFIQDFDNVNLYPQDVEPNPTSAGSQMLEVSYGKPVILPKTPGFSILSNLLSSNKGHIFQIIQKLISEDRGSRDIQSIYGKRVTSRTLATALFRETPPNFMYAKQSTDYIGQQQKNQLEVKSCQNALSNLRQSMIQPLHPTMLNLCFEHACSEETTNCVPDDAVLWRERTLLLSLRILCAVAAREDSFVQSLKQSQKTLSVVPTLVFKGPIHGSFSHRFVEEQKVNLSRLSQLLTNASIVTYGRKHSSEVLPIITEYIGYNACSLSNPQGIALGAFCITSYISHTIPTGACIHSLCGNDVNGIRLARSFARGLSNPLQEIDNQNIARDVILDLILANIGIDSASNLNLSLMILGLSGSKYNCLNVILELIANTQFVLDPKTSSSATKCFEIIFRVCELNPSCPDVRRQQLLFMEKLRSERFWHSQVLRYLGMRGPSTPSILYEISSSYRLEHGDEPDIPRRDNDVLHCISWLLRGLVIELRSLVGHNQPNHFISLLDLLFDDRTPLLQMLIDLPLGQSSNGSIRQIIHVGIPSKDIVDASSVPLQGPLDVCAGFQVVDTAIMLSHFRDDQSSEKQTAIEWATAWNTFVSRVCAFSHISEAWSDVTMTALVCSPWVTSSDEDGGKYSINNSRVVMEMLCTTLLRLTSPDHLEALGTYASLPDMCEDFCDGHIEAECGFPLSNAVLSLTEFLVETCLENESNIQDGAPRYVITEEDAGRICALIIAAISSCSQSGAGMTPAYDRAAILSYALTRILTFSKRQSYCIIAQNNPSIVLEIYASATSFLFGLASSPVFSTEDRYKNVHDAKRGKIAIAARSGLSSLFGYLNSFEIADPFIESFASRIFALDPIATAVSQLVQLITVDDSDVAYILQQIALLHNDGIQLVAKAGVTSALLSFANAYAQEEMRYLSSHMGSNGAASLNPPPTLSGHLSLLNVLLASPLSNSDRLALSLDSYHLLNAYSHAGARLLTSFPSNIETSGKFLETMYLTYSALKKSSSSSGMDNTPLGATNVHDSILGLERSALYLTYQLSAFPFPSRLLPPLPMGLVNVEKIHASQNRNISVSLENERTWWDEIPDTGLNNSPLPDPPTGSSDAGIHQRSNSSDPVWSTGKYQQATSSAKCLEVSLMVLLSRIFFVTQRNLPTFSIDAVAIAKGMCRCSDASRVSLVFLGCIKKMFLLDFYLTSCAVFSRLIQAIEDRLNSMKSHPEDDISKMLDASHVMDKSHGLNSLVSHSMQIEREYLIQLGSSLGSCAEKIVCLALQDARRMISILTSAPEEMAQHEMSKELAYFCAAMMPALEHTQIETKVSSDMITFKCTPSLICDFHAYIHILILFIHQPKYFSQGVGCPFMDGNKETSKAMAQALRQEIEKIRGLLRA